MEDQEKINDPEKSKDSQALDTLTKELEEIKKTNIEYLDQLKRLQADFENYRKRVEKEFEEIKQQGKINIIYELLQIIDNFELAFNNEQSESEFKKGIELIYAQLKELLNNNQVSEFESLGQIFDPNFHQAIMSANDPEKNNNEIIEVFQKGYKINDQILRHAKVKVNKIDDCMSKEQDKSEEK